MAGLGLQLEGLGAKLLRKSFWVDMLNGNLGSDGGGAADGARKFTYEELRRLYDVLERSPTVTESNRSAVVETLRALAEFMIWGDQHEPRIFDFFMENNIMVRRLQPQARVCSGALP